MAIQMMRYTMKFCQLKWMKPLELNNESELRLLKISATYALSVCGSGVRCFLINTLKSSNRHQRICPINGW